MKIILVLLCLSIGLQAANTDAPTVPNTIQFAGLNLKLTEKARRKIQAEVNALTRNPRYFQIKVDRLQIYFPIIERVFDEEGLPQDFKYLALQESALISDAVSSSNAVGFWQFKKEAAFEVGLRIDRNIDERLNIVSSTRGAAKYLKKNNRVFFDNWVHALLAYQQGPGGALKLVKKKYRGSRSMPIDSHTHWYVIKFLAHKIAFEQVKSEAPKLYLVEYHEGQGKTIKEISDQKQMDFAQVQKYNKWLKRGKVPNDKRYTVILPYEQNPALLASTDNNKSKRSALSAKRQAPFASRYPTNPAKYPLVQNYRNRTKGIKINGIRGVRLKEDMELAALERATGVSTKRLLYYNDISGRKFPRAGELWYLKPKGSKAREEYHVVEKGEDLWSVSQKYGIKLSQLRKKNRISKRQTTVKTGRILWLKSTRPSGEPVAYQPFDAPPNDKISTDKTGSDAYRLPEEKQASQLENVQHQFQKITAERFSKKPEQQEYSESVVWTEPEKLAKPEQKVHVVYSGETLYSISKIYGISIEDLRIWNNLIDSNVLSIGQHLIVSDAKQLSEYQTISSAAAETEFILHKVKPGETLYQIARDYQATIKQLMEWNEKSDFNLRIGEELKIQKSF